MNKVRVKPQGGKERREGGTSQWSQRVCLNEKRYPVSGCDGPNNAGKGGIEEGGSRGRRAVVPALDLDLFAEDSMPGWEVPETTRHREVTPHTEGLLTHRAPPRRRGSFDMGIRALHRGTDSEQGEQSSEAHPRKVVGSIDVWGHRGGEGESKPARGKKPAGGKALTRKKSSIFDEMGSMYGGMVEESQWEGAKKELPKPFTAKTDPDLPNLDRETSVEQQGVTSPPLRPTGALQTLHNHQQTTISPPWRANKRPAGVRVSSRGAKRSKVSQKVSQKVTQKTPEAPKVSPPSEANVFEDNPDDLNLADGANEEAEQSVDKASAAAKWLESLESNEPEVQTFEKPSWYML